ncbi:MAG TPA: winged helix DNA-binding domain-containing protein [Gemmatimonadaceae bacterium]|nr:winged helix DNA-binding domain-containing protein [Gemmatimonadaceae bacterium]
MNVAALRLRNQHLLTTTLTRAEDVVRALGAVQSQDYANAKWAIGRRMTAATDADVEHAIASGAILRTHVLRPTWHFVLPEDVDWMLDLTATRVAAAMGTNNRSLGLDASVFRRANAAIERALRDGAQLTRAELAVALRRARVDPTGQRLAHILMQAELDRVVISGGRRGKQFTYASYDTRVPRSPKRDCDDALRDLAERYFATRGPATLQDFAWWSGLTVADAKRAVEASDGAVVRERIADRDLWVTPGARAPTRKTRTTPVVHLLPNYDELFVGFRDRSAFGVRLGREPRLDALMGHMLFVDGQLVGGWRRTLGKFVAVTLRLLVPVSQRERALIHKEVERLGAFLQLRTAHTIVGATKD